MSISRVKELLREEAMWCRYQLRRRLARIRLATWLIVGVAFLVTSLLLGGLVTLFPYADRQSMESGLRIMASTVATFVGFILVALALIVGRASDAREHLESVMPSYKDIDKFRKVRLDYRQALFSSSFSLDEQPMLGPYPRRCAYSHRQIWAAIESIYRMLIFPLAGIAGSHDLVMALHRRGFSSKEIDHVFESATIFEDQPHEFFRALRRGLQLERAYVGKSTAYLASSGILTELREKWESDCISASLDRVERHERATGGRFWAAMLFSTVALVGCVLLALGVTDMTAQMATVRIGFVGEVIAWCMAIVLIIAYLTQLL